MGELDKGGNSHTTGVVSHQPRPNRCRGEAIDREGCFYSRRVHGEDKGGEGYVSGYPTEDAVGL